jgi:hypothetical protein
MTKRRTLALLLLLALPLAACSSNKRPATDNAGRAQARGQRSGGGPQGTSAAVRTTDPGSRFLNTVAPVGGIAVETSPLTGGALVLPYAAQPAGSVDAAAMAAVERAAPPAPDFPPGVLPAPSLPPRSREAPLPPPPVTWESPAIGE